MTRKARKFALSDPFVSFCNTELKGIKAFPRNLSLPSPFVKDYAHEWVLPYNDIFDIVRNGKHLYYVMYSDCHYNNGRKEYVRHSHSEIVYASSQKEARKFAMDGHEAARGFGDGRCVNCLLEISKMHPYEIACIINSASQDSDKIDADKWYASYCEEFS